MDNKEDSIVVRRQRCPVCSSQGYDYKGDNEVVYSDGHAYCFACGTYFENAEKPVIPDKVEVQEPLPVPEDFAEGTPQALPKRHLNLDTCKFFNYCVGEHKGTPVQIAYYYGQTRTLQAAHYRTPDKNFWWSGKTQGVELYGQHLWRRGGKRIVITEGEIDCLSVSQVQANKWPVVSLPSGASGAVKAIKDNLEFVESFETVVLCFDMDEPGRKATKQVADILTKGKVCIVELPTGYKDANDMLKAGKVAELINALWNAQLWRPDGIINAKDLLPDILKEPEQGYQISIPKLCAATRGIHKGKLMLWTAGSGIGKSTIVHEIGYELLTRFNCTIGVIALEETPKRVADRYVGIYLNKPVHLDHSAVTDEELTDAYEHTAGTGRLWIYDHFGSLEVNNLMSKIRYMAVSLNVDFIILDHISIAVSGLEEIVTGDERKLIDILMTKLRSLVEETGVGIIAVSHLKNPPQGKSYSKGLEVDLNALRGSGTLSHIPDFVVALERDQQGDEPNKARIRVIKNRHTGICGVMDTMSYNPDTGRLLVCEDCPFPEESTEVKELKGDF